MAWYDPIVDAFEVSTDSLVDGLSVGMRESEESKLSSDDVVMFLWAWGKDVSV